MVPSQLDINIIELQLMFAQTVLHGFYCVYIKKALQAKSYLAY